MDGPAAHGVMLSRRSVLGLGAAALAAACSRPAASPPPTTTTGPLSPTGLTIGSFDSRARGTRVSWRIARPPGNTARLRTVIALHGWDESAASFIGPGFGQMLGALVAKGMAPVAVAAIDGENEFWHKRASGSDPAAMVLDEFLPLLDERGLDTSRLGFLGWSMGGYGSLLLGARLGPSRVAGVAAISPAVFLDPGDTLDGAFDGPEDYVANSVWGLPGLADVPIRISCGEQDRLYPATREFARQLSPAPVVDFGPGEHDGNYRAAQIPKALAWLAPLVNG